MSTAEALALIQTALVGEALDAGPALVFVADEDMRYIAVNLFACTELGYSRDELLALRVPDVAQGTDAGAEYGQMLARGVHHGTALLTRKDGSTVPFFYRAAKTRAAGLHFFVAVGFLAD